MVDDPDAVAEVLGFVHGVGREHDGDAAVAQLADHGPRRRTRVRIHARGRFVEEHQRRLADQRERQRQPLLLTARHPPHQRVARVVETDELQQPLGVVGIVVVGREELEGFERAHAGIEPALLQHHSDARAQDGAVAPRVDTEDPHLTGVGAAVALEDLDRRRLPRAVRARAGRTPHRPRSRR